MKYGVPWAFAYYYDPEDKVVIIHHNGQDFRIDIKAADKKHRAGKKGNQK